MPMERLDTKKFTVAPEVAKKEKAKRDSLTLTYRLDWEKNPEEKAVAEALQAAAHKQEISPTKYLRNIVNIAVNTGDLADAAVMFEQYDEFIRVKYPEMLADADTDEERKHLEEFKPQLEEEIRTLINTMSNIVAGAVRQYSKPVAKKS